MKVDRLDADVIAVTAHAGDLDGFERLEPLRSDRREWRIGRDR